MATKKKAPKKAKRTPRQGTLKGMEDRALQELEALAEEYAEIRDNRMELNEREVDLNDQLLALMKKHKKSEYHHGEVHCWIKATDEKVKVKIGELTPKQKKKETAEVPAGAAPAAEEPEPGEVEESEDEQAGEVAEG